MQLHTERVTCAQDRSGNPETVIWKNCSATRFTAGISCFFLTRHSSSMVACSVLRKNFSALPTHPVQLIIILQPLTTWFRCFGTGIQSGWGSTRTAFGTCWFLGLPCKLWLLRKHGLTNHSAVTSACLSLPPIHSCYPQWLTIAPFELPAKPQIELLLTSVQLDEWEEADIHSHMPVQNHYCSYTRCIGLSVTTQTTASVLRQTTSSLCVWHILWLLACVRWLSSGWLCCC